MPTTTDHPLKKGTTTMSATATSTALHPAVAGEIAEQKALAQGEIAELRAKIAHPDTRPSFLVSLANDLQGELAYAEQLDFIAHQLAEIADGFDDLHLSLLAQLRYLATEACYLAENTRNESRQVVGGRSTALKAVSDAVYYALYDDLRDGE